MNTHRQLSLVSRLIRSVCTAAMLSLALPAQDTYQQVINRAVRAVPAEWSFPNDDAHIIVIRDYKKFLVSHPSIRERYEFRKLGTEDIAFSVPGSWPIFVNLDRHKAFLDACNRQGGEAICTSLLECSFTSKFI